MSSSKPNKKSREHPKPKTPPSLLDMMKHRLEEIRRKIKEGHYEVDPASLASRLMQIPEVLPKLKKKKRSTKK
jgi:anti-sigma28 factor (negative regulator of flagellin synthesis)